MQIKSIELKNIASFKDSVVFNIEPRRVYHVYGRIGSGKSTLFSEAIRWCLYGDTIKGSKAKDIISDGFKGGYVKLKTDIGIIKRSRNGSETNLTLNRKPIKQEKLASLLQIDKDLFLNSVVFGQGMTGFMLLSDSGKRDLISKIHLDFIDQKIEKLKNYGIAIKDRFDNVEYKLVELSRIEADVMETFNQLREMEKDSKAKLKQDKERLKELKGQSKEHSKAIKILVKKHAKAQEVKKEYVRSKEQLDKTINDLENEISGMWALVKSSKEDLKVTQMDKCPVCFGVIDSAAKKRIKKNIMPLINERTKALEKLNRKLEESIKDRVKVESRLEKVEKEIFGYDRELKNLSEKKSAVNSKIEEIERKSVDPNLVDLADRHKKRLQQIQSELSIMESKKEKYEKYIQAQEFWLLKLKEFRSKMFSTIVEHFVPVCNGYLGRLTNGELRIKIKTGLKGTKRITDKFEVNVLNSEGKVVDLKRLSGGERKMLALSMNMSFAMLMNKFYAQDWNIIVFDEAFDSLDYSARGKVLDLLVGIKNETGKTIILISHEDLGHDEVIPVEVIKNRKGSRYFIR